ncbi:hypothetical protein SAMN06265827_105100 [Orenia metallireducens]|uniref:Uncharacterized protein n=1 Tax=Orenia metallireducens TaxID=1413210 RepID=A0A285G872_9FIRM|nr:hypothetical protein SAMN06265827_105100 [Orenia metallireducens]
MANVNKIQDLDIYQMNGVVRFKTKAYNAKDEEELKRLIANHLRRVAYNIENRPLREEFDCNDFAFRLTPVTVGNLKE